MSDRFDGSSRDDGSPDHVDDTASTLDLLNRFKRGDENAVNLLIERSIPPLRRWARGRLPRGARGNIETQDLVETALLRVRSHLKYFEARHPGALQAYLRQAVASHIGDEIRKAVERPADVEPLEPDLDSNLSPLEGAVGRAGFERYEAALARVHPVDREAIIARVELQQSYEEIALALRQPDADAARVIVTRAITNLARAMVDAL